MPGNPSTGTDYRPVTTYSSITRKSDTFPSANQAIIFPAIDNVPIAYYAKKMINVIGENVLHCAKISGERIRMYLKSREIAENFLKSGGTIEIDRKMVQARWYKKEQTDKRIIISNVPPHVPHDIIIKQMATHDVIPTSQMKFLHISQEEELKNVLSERRSVFIPVESESKLPPSEMITYDEEEYRVFYNNAQVKCFICHQLGHTTASCEFVKKDDSKTAENTKMNSESGSSSSDVKITEQNIENAGLSITEIHENQVEHMDLDPIQNAAKRPLSTSTQLSEELLNLPNITTEEKDKQDKKRIKVEPETESLETISIKQLLAPIEDNFNKNKADYPISFSNFGLLMDMVKGQKDPSQSLLQFTADFKGVIKMLQDNYSYLTHRSMKTRFTKLQNKLKNLTSNELSTTEQDQQLSDENSLD